MNKNFYTLFRNCLQLVSKPPNLLILVSALFFSLGGSAQVTVFESRCVNTGLAIIELPSVVGIYQSTVSAYPLGYDPVSAGANGFVDGDKDSFFAMPAGAYTIDYLDVTTNTTQSFSFVIPGTYVIPSSADFQPLSTPETGCLNANNGTIAGTMSNGRAPYTYTILNGPSSVGVTNATGSFTGLTPGLYQVQAVDSCGNLQTRNVTVTDYTFAVSAPVVSAVSCTSFSLDGITVNPTPAGATYEIVDAGGMVIGSGSSLPVPLIVRKIVFCLVV